MFEADFAHAGGQLLRIHASAIDTGGHHTQAVYAFVAKHAALGRKIFAV